MGISIIQLSILTTQKVNSNTVKYGSLIYNLTATVHLILRNQFCSKKLSTKYDL